MMAPVGNARGVLRHTPAPGVFHHARWRRRRRCATSSNTSGSEPSITSTSQPAESSVDRYFANARTSRLSASLSRATAYVHERFDRRLIETREKRGVCHVKADRRSPIADRRGAL